MTTETLQEAAAEQIQAAVKTGKENLDKAVAAGTEALTAGYDQALALSREQVEKLFPAASTGFDQAAGFQKQNLEALVAAGAVVSKGAEAIGAEFASLSESVFAASAEVAKKFLGCKTFQDAIEVQSGLAREGFDALVAKGTKISEISVQVAGQAFEPLGARIGAATEAAVKTAAKPTA